MPIQNLNIAIDQHNFRGAIIRQAVLGPRRELLVRIETWPWPNQSFGGGKIVVLRFGSIENYEEVERFFTTPPVDDLHYLRASGESMPNRHVIEMEFDRSGSQVTIIAGNIRQEQD